MNFELAPASASDFRSPGLPSGVVRRVDSNTFFVDDRTGVDEAVQERKGLSRFAPCIAFFVAVFASVAAAAAVVNNDMPVLVVGFL